jgi:toxin-antitoxin system PIN domain toxin
MVALLDVNVLVALFDPEHVHHDAAHGWFAAQRPDGWATCPLTENALLRIVSNPVYPGRSTTVADALERLTQFRASGNHSFWQDSVSLCEPARVDPVHIAGHAQVTDVYLLSLAVEHGGSLATFDRRIALASIRAARSDNLVLITG